MTQIDKQEITNRKKGSNEKVSYQLDALQKTIISLGKQVLLLGGQTQSARNGGLLRIPALNGTEKEGKKKAVAQSTLSKRDDLLWKGSSIFRYICSYMAYRYSTSLFRLCYFFKKTNQVRFARSVSLFKMKIRTTVGTATFTCSKTNYQDNILQLPGKMEAHRSYFMLIDPTIM